MTASSSVSRVAIDTWNSLTDKERFETVAWAAWAIRRRGASWQLGTGVKSLGHGKRERRRKDGVQEVVGEPVLAVFVRKKWTERGRTLKTRKAGSVPIWIELRVPIAGKRRRVAIPTDVCETLGPGIPHASDEIVRTLRIHDADQNYLQRGTACALVSDESDGLSVLTCRHVAYPSMMVSNYSSDRDRSAIVRSREAGRPDAELGFRKRSARFQPGTVAFDAALVRVPSDTENGVRRLSFWNTIPSNWANSELVIREANTAVIQTKAANWIPVRFLKTALDEEMNYRNLGVLAITEVLLLRIEALDGLQPGPGDSGAPVLNGKTLVGMYLGVRRDRLTAIVLPAYQLFRGCFAEPIELASSLIG